MASSDVKIRISAQDKTKQAFKSVNKNLGVMSTGFKAFAVAAAGVFAGKFVTSIKGAAASLGQISDQADKLGLTTDALQELRFAAEQAGVKVTSFDVGFQRFTRRAADAAAGNKALAKTFADFNIELADQQGRLKSNEALFLEFADAIQESDDQGKRILKTFQLFDTEGVDLVRLLQQGSGAIKDFREEARTMGAVVDESMIRKADAADKKLSALSRVIGANLKPAIAELAPLLVAAAQKLAGLTKAASDFLRKIGVTSTTNPFTQYSDEIDRLEGKIDHIRTKRDSFIGKGVAAFMSPQQLEDEQKEIADMVAQIAVLKNARDHFANAPAGGAAAGGLFLPDAETEGAEKLKKAAVEVRDEWDIAFDLIDAQFAEIDQQWAQGFTGLETVKGKLGDVEEKAEETGKEMSVFAEQASRNMQDDFAQFLFDPFDDGLKGMLKGFADTMRNMVAQAAAAKIFEGIGGGLSGSSNSVLAGIGSFFSASTQRASGGPLAAGQVSLVGERGPEMFVSDTAGTIVPNDKLGGDIEININNAPPGTSATTSRGPDGRQVINLLLGEVANSITSNGVVGRAFDSSRGTRMAPATR